MNVTLNGERAEVADGTALPALVGSLSGFVEGVAVAVNGAVVPGADWAGTRLAEGDQVEVLVATQGG